MNNEDYQEYRLLQMNGIDVQKTSQIRFNHGSETLKHELCKLIVGHIGKNMGYNVASEVEIENVGETDIVLWGNQNRLTYCVEVETSPTKETMADKRNRYVRGPIEDMLSVNVTECPVNYLEAQEYVADELGLGI